MAPRNGFNPNSSDQSPLVSAALSLEAELSTLESISRATRKIPLNSEKNITRAARELEQALALPERLAAGLQQLALAMAGVQERQQAVIEPLAAFATEIQRRHQRLLEHMQAFASLGTAASEITARIQAGSGDRAAILSEVDAQLAKISADARALAELTRAEDFPDLVREADALKQRAAALRRRLSGEK